MAAETDSKRESTLRPLAHLVPYILCYRKLAIGALVFLMLAAVTTLILPTAVRRMIAADAARSDDGAGGVDGEVTDDLARAPLATRDGIGLEDGARGAGHSAVGDCQCVDAVAEAECDAAFGNMNASARAMPSFWVASSMPR